MKTIRTRLCSQRDNDAGISLVEVLVAMMIFAIISVGVAYSLGTMMTQVRDARAREVATNLAAQEIDVARATANLTTLLRFPPSTKTVNGVVYTVERVTEWVTGEASTGACGINSTVTQTGELQYKRVDVTVSWPSSGGSKSVSSETLIAPTARVSAATEGTIIVSIRNELGGLAGIGVTVSPAVSPAPSLSDAEGCIYIPKVAARSYTVTINAPGYIDTNQTVNPPKVVTTVAGKSAAAFFQLEPAQPLQLRYGSVKIPKDLTTSFVHASDPTFFSTASNANAVRSVSLYPFREGYLTFAGRYVAANEAVRGCLSPHPGMWEAGYRAGTYVAAAPPSEAKPGPGAGADISMGTVSFTKSQSGTKVLAVPVAAGPAGSGDPGCADVAVNYNFDGLSNSSGGTVTLALPFGSWQLYFGDTVSASKLITTGLVASTVTGSIVTLDPRVPATPPVTP